MKNVSKLTRTTSDRTLLEGVEKHLAADAPFVLDGRTIRPSDLAPTLRKRIAAEMKTAVKKAEWLAAVAEEKALVEETNDIVTMYRQILLLMFHSQGDVLADLGLAHRKKPRPLTTDERALKVARAKATREARGTLGPRQRLRIHGVVPDPVDPPKP
jgi:hypothetical protein